MILTGLLLLLLACAEPPTPDARLYLAALQTRDPAACAPIIDPQLRGECAAMAARDLARAGRTAEAQQACAILAPGPWQDECYFMLADAAADTPQRARDLCAQAGRFRDQCLGHAIARAVSGPVNAMAPGGEQDTVAALHEAMAPYIPGEAGRRRRVEGLVAKAIAGRQPGDHFGPGACGTAPPPICRQAYAERLRTALRRRGAPDGAWRAACPPPVTPQRAGALGLPTWDAELDPIIAEGWVELCR